jgi:AhpD family alkylhydroperoxidase
VDALEPLRSAIPDVAKDIRLNLHAVLRGGSLSEPQRWGKPIYGEKRAGLRMNRLMQPATNRTDFELMALAVSALNGGEMCVRAHEKTVTAGGLTPDHVNDAVRIAATACAAAVALEAGEAGAAEAPPMEVSARGA